MSKARRISILLPSALGWMLFVYWWARVAHESTAAAATTATALLTIITVAVFYTTILWIRHNLELARRGKRGKSTLYIPAVPERDWLNRTVVITAPAAGRHGTWFVVHTDANEKHYTQQRLIAA